MLKQTQIFKVCLTIFQCYLWKSKKKAFEKTDILIKIIKEQKEFVSYFLHDNFNYFVLFGLYLWNRSIALIDRKEAKVARKMIDK